MVFQYEFVRMNGDGCIIERVPLDLQSNLFLIQVLFCPMALSQSAWQGCEKWIQNGWSASIGRITLSTPARDQERYCMCKT